MQVDIKLHKKILAILFNNCHLWFIAATNLIILWLIYLFISALETPSPCLENEASCCNRSRTPSDDQCLTPKPRKIRRKQAPLESEVNKIDEIIGKKLKIIY